MTPEKRDASYTGRNAYGRRWRTNDVTTNVSPRVGQSINDEILHRGLTESVVKQQHNQSSFVDAAKTANCLTTYCKLELVVESKIGEFFQTSNSSFCELFAFLSI